VVSQSPNCPNALLASIAAASIDEPGAFAVNPTK
jgi:hypothetical protein